MLEQTYHAGLLTNRELVEAQLNPDPLGVLSIVEQAQQRVERVRQPSQPETPPQAGVREVRNADGSIDLFAVNTTATGATTERFVRRIPPPVPEVGPAGIRTQPGAPAGNGLPQGGSSRRINDLFGD